MEKITTLVFKEGGAQSCVSNGIMTYSCAEINACNGKKYKFEGKSLATAEQFIRNLSESLNDFIDVVAAAKLHGAK